MPPRQQGGGAGYSGLSVGLSARRGARLLSTPLSLSRRRLRRRPPAGGAGAPSSPVGQLVRRHRSTIVRPTRAASRALRVALRWPPDTPNPTAPSGASGSAIGSAARSAPALCVPPWCPRPPSNDSRSPSPSRSRTRSSRRRGHWRRGRKALVMNRSRVRFPWAAPAPRRRSGPFDSGRGGLSVAVARRACARSVGWTLQHPLLDRPHHRRLRVHLHRLPRPTPSAEAPAVGRPSVAVRGADREPPGSEIDVNRSVKPGPHRREPTEPGLHDPSHARRR